MRWATWIALAVTSSTALQDDWRPLSLTRLDDPADSVVTAGVSLTPEVGALNAVMAFTARCSTKVRATYQPHGAVVKIRLIGPDTAAVCRGEEQAQAYGARVGGLKPKRYQVVVYTKDSKGKWHPWKAGVAVVPTPTP